MNVVFGVISATTQVSPGPVSSVSFTVAAQLEEGPVSYSHVKPSNAVPSDDWDVDCSELVDTWIVGYRHPDGRIRWIIPMWPDAFDCPEE